MATYETCDVIITYRGKDIPPYTEVDVPEEDARLWNDLVLQKMATRLDEDRDGPERPGLHPSPSVGTA